MILNMSEIRASLEELVEHSSRLSEYLHQQLKWRDVHPLAQVLGAEGIAFGLAAKRWLPSPSKSFLATLADLAEERGDPEFFQEVAAVLQRLAFYDTACKAHFFEIASRLEELRRIEDGCAGLAMQAEAELETLIAAAADSWSTLEEVLGEGHARAKDLLILAMRRLLSEPTNWQAVLAVVYRLRKPYVQSIALSSRCPPAFQWDTVRCMYFLEIALLWYGQDRSGPDGKESFTEWFHSLRETDGGRGMG